MRVRVKVRVKVRVRVRVRVRVMGPGIRTGKSRAIAWSDGVEEGFRVMGRGMRSSSERRPCRL